MNIAARCHPCVGALIKDRPRQGVPDYATAAASEALELCRKSKALGTSGLHALGELSERLRGWRFFATFTQHFIQIA